MAVRNQEHRLKSVLREEGDVLDFLGNLKRTHYCGELRAKDEGRDAVVMGWWNCLAVRRPRELALLLAKTD